MSASFQNDFKRTANHKAKPLPEKMLELLFFFFFKEEEDNCNIDINQNHSWIYIKIKRIKKDLTNNGLP